MNDLLSKISSYNIFNYLLPGIIFVVLAKGVTHYSFIQQDIVIGLFLYYFIGLVISSFGSLTIEPLLRRLSFLPFADYKDFVDASKKDEKIEVLSEANNMYRTLLSLFTLLLLLKLHEKIESMLPVLKNYDAIILIVLLLVMFLFKYRRQTGYITKRIKANG
jgi:hypothetical protein